jgi:hypothetical protein
MKRIFLIVGITIAAYSTYKAYSLHSGDKEQLALEDLIYYLLITGGVALALLSFSMRKKRKKKSNTIR